MPSAEEKMNEACQRIRTQLQEEGLGSITSLCNPVFFARILLEDADSPEAADLVKSEILDYVFGDAAPAVGHAIERGSDLPCIPNPVLEEAAEALWTSESPLAWGQLIHAAAPNPKGQDRNPFFRYKEGAMKRLWKVAESLGY